MNIKKKIINLLAFIYAKLISLNLYLLNKKYKSLCYNHSLGFGDSIIYYLSFYTKIKKTNYVIDFSFLTSDVTNFFFEKNKIKKIFLYIFKYLPHYNIRNFLIKFENFKPNFFNLRYLYELDPTNCYPKNKDSIKNLIIAKLNINYDNNFNAKKIFGKNYFCISIKSTQNSLSLDTSAILRGTYNLDIVIQTINYLIKKNYKICILGKNNEASIVRLKKILINRNPENIKFLADYSKNYSFTNQVDTCLNSLGYIGSPYGISILFYYLHKKSILLNTFFSSYINNIFAKHEIKFNKSLYKKIKINNTLQVLTLNNYESIKNLYYEDVIVENSFEEILYEINNFLLNKN
jgi:hypothetical protein